MQAVRVCPPATFHLHFWFFLTGILSCCIPISLVLLEEGDVWVSMIKINKQGIEIFNWTEFDRVEIEFLQKYKRAALKHNAKTCSLYITFSSIGGNTTHYCLHTHIKLSNM